MTSPHTPKRINRILSVLLIFVLLLGFLPGFAPGAAAEGETTSYAYTLTVDDATSAAPSAAVTSTDANFAADGFGSSDSDGRVWVDKSVAANADGTSFDVTLSALAQEYITTSTTTTTSQAAADVLLILDMTGSMESNKIGTVSRGALMVEAAN